MYYLRILHLSKLIFNDTFEAMSFSQVLEVAGALTSIIYSLLLMKEKTAGWWFGIASSLIGTFLFFHTRIYAQSLISLYYAGVGFYGLWYWKTAEKRNEHIHVWTFKTHVTAIGTFILLSWIAGMLFKTYTDSQSPYLDSFITLFGLLASVKEARKILTSWVYWFIINGMSVMLYYQQELYYYAALMVVYTIICISGYLSWYRIYQTHQK